MTAARPIVSQLNVAAAPLTVIVNGEDCSLAAVTLAEVLDRLGYGNAKVATAVNGEFVPTARRAATTLADGDRIEIVAPRQGG